MSNILNEISPWPWSHAEDPGCICDTTGEMIVSQTIGWDGLPCAQTRANLSLMVHAPEMLDALRGAREELENALIAGRCGQKQKICDVVAEINAAIAKVE